jgi:HSP20 family protein
MREFDELFSDFLASPLVRSEQRTWYLPLDVVDTGSAYQVKAAVPGFKPEEIEVQFQDKVLSIKAQRRAESERREGNYLRREMTFGNLARSIQLPGDVNVKDIKAAFEDGILTIDIPKMQAPQPTKIPVSGKSQPELVSTAKSVK